MQLYKNMLYFRDLGLINYSEGLKQQEYYKKLVNDGIYKGAFLFLEHTPVYTIGKKNKKNEQYYDYLRKIAEVYFVDRGGDITFHGPGQLVIYPILNLSYWNKDLHLYLRALEEVVIIMLKKYNIISGRKAKYTGVWVGNEKICSIGIACRNWITWHGLALNVDVNLDYFDYIVPCGIREFGVTSFKKLGFETSIDDVKAHIKYSLNEVFSKDAVYS
jgi:lipoyl(octanoyl) transferase